MSEFQSLNDEAGQPVPQLYFHRPLHSLLGTFLEEGFVMDGVE